RFFLEQQVQVDAIFAQELAASFDDSEVEEIVFQRSSDQVFEGKIEKLFGTGALEARPRFKHPLDQHVAHRQRRNAIPVVFRHLDAPLGGGEANMMIQQADKKS